ncbi:MAG: DUF3060 domain-containing protein [Chloroflexota bacterium]
MMETERLQKYLDELTAHRGMAQDVAGAECAPDLQELAAAITNLEHPVLPPAVDARYQAHLMAVGQSAPAAEPSSPKALAGLDGLRTALAQLTAGLRIRFTRLHLAGALAAGLILALFGVGLLLTIFLVNNGRMKAAQVTAVVGQVEVLTDEGWASLHRGDSVRSGQHIRTNSYSSATVRFFEDTETTIAADSEVTLTTVSGRLGGGLRVTWTQSEGATSHEVVPLRGRTAFYQVETPGGTVQVQGTSFAVAVQPDGQTRVSVTEGQVTMIGSGETVTLQTGQATLAGPGLALAAAAYQFAGQGELTHIAGTLWTIGNLPVTVIGQTVIVGDPTVGDFVSVSGRIVSGNVWLADVITASLPGASSFSFTAAIENMGPNFWQIGAVTVAVTRQTQLIGNLELGTLAQVTFTALSDGTLVALVIEEIGKPLPTPTATATLTTTVTMTPSVTATATPTMTPFPPLIVDCYQITFLGVVYHPDNTSTWTYHVAELPCAQDLSNWMVALPSCARSVAATPEPWEYVNPDPNYRLTGVKWEVGAGFDQGVFAVTVNGHWAVGTTQGGVKGPDVGIGLTAGPICALPSPTLTPTGSVSPTATPSMTPTLTPMATLSATPTLTPAVTVSATATATTMATATVTPAFTATPLPTATLVPTTATPAPPPPIPTQPPPGGSSPIAINENGQTRTFTCNGNSVTINGNDNTITLLGSCGPVTIRGNNNWVSIQSATLVTNTGNNNTIVGP